MPKDDLNQVYSIILNHWVSVKLTNSLIKDYLGEFTVEKLKIENADSSKFKIVLNQIIWESSQEAREVKK